MRYIPFWVAFAVMAGCGGDDDGGPVRFALELRNVSAPGALATTDGAVDIMLAPGVYVVADPSIQMFELGHRASAGLERLAEDGENEPLFDEMVARDPAVSGIFGADTPGANYAESPIPPGELTRFEFLAAPGERLHLASMFIQSNDTFLGSRIGGIDPFESVEDTSELLALFDAGTEVNEEPGTGPSQAPRQSAPATGDLENEDVRQVDASDGFPSIDTFVELVITRAPSDER